MSNKEGGSSILLCGVSRHRERSVAIQKITYYLLITICYQSYWIATASQWKPRKDDFVAQLVRKV